MPFLIPSLCVLPFRDVLAYVASKGLQKIPQVAGPIAGAAPAATPSASAAAAPKAIPGAGYTDMPLTAMRATIAKRLLESKATIPHAYTSATMTVDSLFALQKAVNKAKLVDTKISINDLILKACAYSLRVSPKWQDLLTDFFYLQHSTGKYLNVQVTMLQKAVPNNYWRLASPIVDPVLLRASSHFRERVNSSLWPSGEC